MFFSRKSIVVVFTSLYHLKLSTLESGRKLNFDGISNLHITPYHTPQKRYHQSHILKVVHGVLLRAVFIEVPLMVLWRRGRGRLARVGRQLQIGSEKVSGHLGASHVDVVADRLYFAQTRLQDVQLLGHLESTKKAKSVCCVLIGSEVVVFRN